MKRVIIVHRYFWPNNYPYAMMLKEIAESLLAAGFEVTILTTRSGAKHENDLRNEWSIKHRSNIKTLKLKQEKQLSTIRKAGNAFYFGIWVFFKLLVSKPEFVWVATTPPIMNATLVRWTSKITGFKYLYHCQDIYPEALNINHYLSNTWLYRVLKRIDRKNIDSASSAIVLSNDMRRTLIDRGCLGHNIVVINNFSYYKAETQKTISDSKKLRFLFAGSLGRFQNLEILMRALADFRNREEIEFCFMGDGILKPKLIQLKNELRLKNVLFVGQQTAEQAAIAMTIADFGIVSVAPNVTRVAYPSKTITYLSHGLPILALVDEESDLFRFIATEKIGYAVAPTSIEAIKHGIDQLLTNNKIDPIERQHVCETARRYFDKTTILTKMAETFIKLEREVV